MADATIGLVFNSTINRKAEIAPSNSSDVPEGISISELNVRLERGYSKALAGQGKSVDEVFNKLLRGRS